MRLTKKAYVEHLNECAPTDSDEYIIGGVLRMSYFHTRDYGNAIRKFDPIAFEVGFREWKLENS